MRKRKASLPVFGLLIVGGVFFLIGDGSGSKIALPLVSWSRTVYRITG